MKPINIYLIRHGESYGNVNAKVYEHIPDWKIPLTEKGKVQAERVRDSLWKKLEAAKWVEKSRRNTLQPPLVAVYCSPWYRARETALPFMKKLKAEMPLYTYPTYSSEPLSAYTYKEDPRLREQEWGNFKEEPWSGKIGRERQKFGTFFYRMPFGESGADVFDRISTFNETLHRDFRKTYFPENLVIFSHGLTIRIFLMRWFHWEVEKFQNIKNPRNGQIIEMRRPVHSDNFELRTKLSIRVAQKSSHSFRCKKEILSYKEKSKISYTQKALKDKYILYREKTHIGAKHRKARGWVDHVNPKRKLLSIQCDDNFKGSRGDTISFDDVIEILPDKLRPCT